VRLIDFDITGTSGYIPLMRIKTAPAIYAVSLALLMAPGRAASALDRTDPGPQAPAVRSGVVDVGTAKIRYEEAGKGEPLVMIHGGLLTKEMWDG
jgi:hypothetical protein